MYVLVSCPREARHEWTRHEWTYEGLLKRARTLLELAAFFEAGFPLRLAIDCHAPKCHIAGTRGADTTPASTETLHGVATPAGHGERRCQGACHRSIRLWSRGIRWPRNSIGICGGRGFSRSFEPCVFGRREIRGGSSECLL